MTVEVSHTGCGMDADALALYATKAPGESAGLGPSMSCGTIRQRGRHVARTISPGVGTTHTIYLPSIADVAEAERYFCRRTMRASAPTRCTHPAANVAARRGLLEPLVAEVAVPYMVAREVAERLARNYPGMRVLFVSEYAQGAAALPDGAASITQAVRPTRPPIPGAGAPRRA